MSNTVNNYTETDLGNISLNPRGEYDDSADYEYLDAVSYQGGSYFCLAELETTITGIAPDAGRNSEHWQMIAAPGDMTPEYTAAYNNVINKAVQVEASRAAVELAQQEIETSQADVQELHSDTVQAAQEAENSKNSAANSAQSAEQSKNAASESEQNVNNTLVAFDDHVEGKKSEADAAINKTKDAAIKAVMDQQSTSVQAVKDQTASYITEKETSAKTEIGNYTSEKIAEINKKASEANITLANTITDGNSLKTQLETTISTADTSKKNLDASNTVATKTKADLDTSNTTATKTKADLDTSNTTASETKTGLDATNKTAAGLVTSLGDKIAEGTQVKNDIQTTGETAMSNLQAEAAKQQEYIKASIDDTLSISGKAADAAVTGKKISSLKEALTSKADKTALVKTDRKLDALWKLNQGISYELQTDDTEAYQKTVPSGAKVANVKSIGGKTIVWNQLCGECIEKSGTISGVGYYIGKYISFNGTIEEQFSISSPLNESIHMLSTHKYLVMIGDTGANLLINLFNEDFSEDVALNVNMIYTPSKSLECRIIRFMYGNSQIGKTVSYNGHIQLFDLTQMFGSGNEPSTPEEFEAMFSADYYPYNAGELMSAPVNEVVEQGRNLFDCYGFSCTSIRDIAAKRDIANDYGTIISTIDPTNRLIVTQNKADGSLSDFRNGYFNIGIRGLKYNTKYILAFDFTPTKMLIVDPLIALFVNGKPDYGDKVSGFSLNVKKHVTIKFVYKANNDMQTLELRNSGMSGIFENFQIEEGTTVATYSPYHKTSYQIPQAILNLTGYGWSVGNVRNEVDWENKQYIQRVGKYVITGDESFQTTYMPTIVFNNSSYRIKPGLRATNNRGLNISSVNNYGNDWQFGITDLGLDENATTDDIKEWFKEHPVTVYYPMFNEEIIDISDLIGNTFQEPLEVEAGGTLMFKNSNGDNYRIPVPSTEEYLVSLAEVAK